ncbi:MAG: hypothetical protein ACXVZN_03630 [Gaiellaceae bacterium]
MNGKYVVDGTFFVDFVRPLWRLVGGKPVIDGEHEADAFALTPVGSSSTSRLTPEADFAP